MISIPCQARDLVRDATNVGSGGGSATSGSPAAASVRPMAGPASTRSGLYGKTATETQVCAHGPMHSNGSLIRNAFGYRTSRLGLTRNEQDSRETADQAALSSARNTIDTPLPQRLPNGIPFSPRYQRLLAHFTGDILASLSCHPSIHHDLGQGLVPVTLESPQLMSACLALSAAGFLSRGLFWLDGVEVAKVLGHLQSSGLALLRSALETTPTTTVAKGQMNETLLATCLIWCLVDVFTYRRFEGTLSSSWRIHLQGIRALLDRDDAGARRDFITSTPGAPTGMQMAMRHLKQLYLSLQTLPYIIPASGTTGESENGTTMAPNPPISNVNPGPSPAIDGFLGYSDELLDIVHQIDQLSRAPSLSTFEADVLLGKVQAMITRDSITAPPILLSTATRNQLSTVSGLPLERGQELEFTLCHQIFQQATLIQLYRRLYHLPSREESIQAAVCAMQGMLTNLHAKSQKGRDRDEGGESMWVAMAMPLFTLGCEAINDEQRRFVMEGVDRLETHVRSLHVRIIRQALVDVWQQRKELGDDGRGEVCAGRLLGELFLLLSHNLPAPSHSVHAGSSFFVSVSSSFSNVSSPCSPSDLISSEG